MNEFKHGEAFMVMQYQDVVTGEIEKIWNSRDGVTPFMITSRQGNDAHHINWRGDSRKLDFIPPVGSRVFVDASPDQPHMREAASRYVEKYWDLDIGGMTMKKTFSPKTKDETIEYFISEWTKPGSPTLIEVNESAPPEKSAGRTG
jgi:hypothetical protein